MRHRPRPHAAAALVLSLLLLVPAPAAAQPFDGDPSTVRRVDEGLPINAAVAVSRLRFADDGATSAVLVTLADSADALTGTSLTDRAPLLLTGPDRLNELVAGELTRVLPAGAPVFLLGGDQALAQRVADEVAALGLSPRRLAGASRFETAVAVARERLSRGPVTEVLLARGLSNVEPTAGWADAVAGGAAQLRPILLTPTATPHEAVAAFLEEVPNATVVILGGTSAVSSQVESATPRVVARLAGASRDATAAAIANRFFGVTTETRDRRIVLFDGYVASGWKFGLPAAPLAREQGAPLMPVGERATARATATLVGCGATRADVLVIGSEAGISADELAAHRTCP